MPINEPVTFVVFAGDLASYALKQLLRIEYAFPPQTTPHRRAFHKTIGEAAMIFRDRHADQFGQKMAEANKTSVVADVKSLMDYFEDFVEHHFKGRVPLMELIVFCAFLVDLVVCCADNGRTDLVDDVVAETYDVYSKHVKPYFDIAGGWMSLLRIAKDYLCYVESLQKYGLLFAADAENNTIVGEKDAAIPKKNGAVSEKDVIMSKKDQSISGGTNTKEECNVEENVSCDNSAISLRYLLSNSVKPGSSSVDMKNETVSSNKLFNDLDTEYMKKLSIQTSQTKSDSDGMSVSSNEAVCLSSENTLLANLLSVMKTSVASIKTSNNDTDDSFFQAASSNNASVIETSDAE